MSEEIAFPGTTGPGDHRGTSDEQWGHYSADALLPLVYSELRRLAAVHLANESPGQTLQATALVHEAYLRLIAAGRGKEWSSRGHFFRAAAEAMRRILVDKARRKAAAKWGGGLARVSFDDAALTAINSDEVIAVNDALEGLQQEDPLTATLVKLHYFSGFSLEESAELLGMSRATAYRLWTFARAWLRAAFDDRQKGF